LQPTDEIRSEAAAPAPQGKASIRRNALRHGLAAVVLRAPAISAEVDRLATAICGADADPTQREQALNIAESEFMLVRVRAARTNVIEQMSLAPPTQAPDTPYLGQLMRLERYERRAVSRREHAMRALIRASNAS
jgi:hypothetical protein